MTAASDYIEVSPAEHGRIEARRIWYSIELNAYIDFPHLGQVSLFERDSLDKKSGEHSMDVALGHQSHARAGITPTGIGS